MQRNAACGFCMAFDLGIHDLDEYGPAPKLDYRKFKAGNGL
jgi:hypothetical protein